jgi:thioredoxin reductase (NADPH)
VALHDHVGVLGVALVDGIELRAHSVIVATGVTYRTLDVPGSDRLAGRGVYYGAAITEAASIRDEDVLVVGGANSAGQAAIYFSDFARSVTMLVRGDALSKGMSHYLVERIESTANIHVRCNTRVEELMGLDQLETVMVRDTTTGACEALPASALFIFIGAVPRTAWLDGTLARDDHGFLLTGPEAAGDGTCSRWSFDRDPFLLESNIPGVFVAGDVRHGAGKRVATAVGEGAMAVMSIWQHRVRCGL